MAVDTSCPTCGAATVSRSATRPRYCAECYRLRRLDSRRAWRERNYEQERAAIRAYKEKHREEIRAKGRIVIKRDMTCQQCGEGFIRTGNRGPIPKWCEECRAERMLAQSREFYQRHTERVIALSQRNAARRRAAVRDIKADKVDRLVVFERDGWTCQLCGMPVFRVLMYPDPWSPSLDHILPLSRGGDHTYANVQLAHLRCNLRKSDRVQEVA